MTRTLPGKLLVADVLLLLAAACTQDPGASFEPECTVNQFRACETEVCRGVQQCREPGVWQHCACTVLDASYASDSTPEDAASESDAGTEAASPEDAAAQ